MEIRLFIRFYHIVFIRKRNCMRMLFNPFLQTFIPQHCEMIIDMAKVCWVFNIRTRHTKALDVYIAFYQMKVRQDNCCLLFSPDWKLKKLICFEYSHLHNKRASLFISEKFETLPALIVPCPFIDFQNFVQPAKLLGLPIFHFVPFPLVSFIDTMTKSCPNE